MASLFLSYPKSPPPEDSASQVDTSDGLLTVSSPPIWA